MSSGKHAKWTVDVQLPISRYKWSPRRRALFRLPREVSGKVEMGDDTEVSGFLVSAFCVERTGGDMVWREFGVV